MLVHITFFFPPPPPPPAFEMFLTKVDDPRNDEYVGVHWLDIVSIAFSLLMKYWLIWRYT